MSTTSDTPTIAQMTMIEAVKAAPGSSTSGTHTASPTTTIAARTFAALTEESAAMLGCIREINSLSRQPASAS